MPTYADALLGQITELIERGQKLKVVVPQDTGFFTLEPGLVERIVTLLRETIEVLRQVTHTFENDPPARGASTLTPQEVADLAFICRTELVELESSLSLAAQEKNLWKTAAEADRSVARAMRAMIPIETALCEYSGHEPPARSWFDLDDALAIRRLFVDFWLETRRYGSPTGETLSEAFESFGARIATLRQDPIYPYLRIDDRLQIRSLQKRILAHLEQLDAITSADGPRLWQDLVGFFDLLMHIHRREELREHDQLLVGRIFRNLYDLANVPERLPAANHEQLRSLASLEPSLDVLLLDDEPGRAADYREPLRLLREKLM